jgi:hypothetical protein
LGRADRVVQQFPERLIRPLADARGYIAVCDWNQMHDWHRMRIVAPRVSKGTNAQGSFEAFRALSVAPVEHKMPAEKWENFRVDTTIVAPDSVSPEAVVFLGFMRDSEFVQLMG